MKEVGVLIDLEGQPIYWHLPEDRSSGALPDSRNLWDVIWENRDKVSGFAHTHPGYGKPGPSYTDITTFAAIETGLGRRLHWWIATGDQLSVVLWMDESPQSGKPGYVCCPCKTETPWLVELRERSGFLISG